MQSSRSTLRRNSYNAPCTVCVCPHCKSAGVTLPATLARPPPAFHSRQPCELRERGGADGALPPCHSRDPLFRLRARADWVCRRPTVSSAGCICPHCCPKRMRFSIQQQRSKAEHQTANQSHPDQAHKACCRIAMVISSAAWAPPTHGRPASKHQGGGTRMKPGTGHPHLSLSHSQPVA